MRTVRCSMQRWKELSLLSLRVLGGRVKYIATINRFYHPPFTFKQSLIRQICNGSGTLQRFVVQSLPAALAIVGDP